MKHSTLYFVAVLSFALGGCTGCNPETPDETVISKTNDEVIENDFTVRNVQEGDIEITQEIFDDVSEKLGIYFDGQANGDFEGMLDHTVPEVYESTSKAEVIDMFLDNYASGWRNPTEKHDILFMTPFVEYNNYRVSLMDVDFETRVYFTEDAKGKIENYQGMVKAKYGESMTSFDEENQQYIVKGVVKMFAVQPLDGSTTYFAPEQILQAPYASSIVDRNLILKLRNYE